MVGWESAIGEVWDDEQSHAKLVYDVHVPFLINEGYGVGETLNFWNPGQPAPARLLGDDPAAVDRLLQDPRFRSIVEIRYLYKLHTTEEFEQAVAAAEEILTEIEKGL